MHLSIFWSILALFYFVLAVVTGISLRSLKQDLSKLEDISPSGISNAKGRIVQIEFKLYKALIAILITDIVGFLLAAGAAIIPIISATN